MNAHYDVAILGAGIVGTACAMEFARAGLKTVIVEPQVLGGGATAAGMGHVVVMDDSPAQLALTQMGRELWQQLRHELPAAVEYEQRGTLWVAADEEEMQEVYAKQTAYQRVGVASSVLDAQALAEAEPELRRGLSGALLVPDDGVAYPPVAARFFLDEAIRSGATYLHGVRPVSAGGGKVLLQNGTHISTGAIIVATGIDKSLVPFVEMQPRKGHLVITDRYPGFVNHQLVELGYLKSAHKLTADSVAFNVQPRKTGQLLIGSSRQYGDTSPQVSPAVLRSMMERATAYLPRVHTLSAVRVWTGFRAATPDKLPLIGPSPDPTVFLAMGFEGLGITNAPAAARLVTDHVLSRPSAINRAPYLPERIVAHEVAHA